MGKMNTSGLKKNNQINLVIVKRHKSKVRHQKQKK